MCRVLGCFVVFVRPGVFGPNCGLPHLRFKRDAPPMTGSHACDVHLGQSPRNPPLGG